MRKGAQTLVFGSKPVILSRAAIGGKKEGEGPLAAYFDFLGKDAKLGQKTFEKAESKLQELALDTAKRKLGISYEDIDVLFAGDLLNQCISSSFAARGTSIPFLGLYGACSTMAESLLLAAAFVEAGFADTAAALTSSHFASAERQYRYPLEYGNQRSPASQWTVTGGGAVLLSLPEALPGTPMARLARGCIGRVVDLGVTDNNNMGAAMAPAAAATLCAYMDDTGDTPEQFDRIITGDLGMVGSDALIYRLVFNLVENGIKYNRLDGAVRVTLRREKQTAVLRVADTGPGIPADCRESIFQPFFRVDKSRSREMGGVGLGLALVREIAVLHGGSVTVESGSENGTTFVVTLPLAQPC